LDLSAVTLQRDRWFESCALQGRVRCEPDFAYRTPQSILTVDLVTGESHGSFLWLVTAEGIDTLTSAPDAT
jgi:hypothetical protein